MKKDEIVKIYTDGSCLSNPGPGGWCAILKYKNIEKVIAGGEVQTTNNRMELKAVIEGLMALKKACNVEIITDSKYIVDSVNKGWAVNWKKNNWVKSDKNKAQNTDLWDILLDEISKHLVSFIWIKGHDGHPENERCDKLAVEQSMLFKQEK